MVSIIAVPRMIPSDHTVYEDYNHWSGTDPVDDIDLCNLMTGNSTKLRNPEPSLYNHPLNHDKQEWYVMNQQCPCESIDPLIVDPERAHPECDLANLANVQCCLLFRQRQGPRCIRHGLFHRHSRDVVCKEAVRKAVTNRACKMDSGGGLATASEEVENLLSQLFRFRALLNFLSVALA